MSRRSPRSGGPPIPSPAGPIVSLSSALRAIRRTAISTRQAGVDEGERYTAALGDDPAELAEVRTALRGMAIRNGFADRAGDLVLALDEVIANAQEHGRPPIDVQAWFDGRLVVEVSDVGGGFDRARVWSTHPPPPLGQRGRGLWIIRQLTDLVAIRSDGHGTTVRIELSPDPHIGA